MKNPPKQQRVLTSAINTDNLPHSGKCTVNNSLANKQFAADFKTVTTEHSSSSWKENYDSGDAIQFRSDFNEFSSLVLQSRGGMMDSSDDIAGISLFLSGIAETRQILSDCIADLDDHGIAGELFAPHYLMPTGVIQYSEMSAASMPLTRGI